MYAAKLLYSGKYSPMIHNDLIFMNNRLDFDQTSTKCANCFEMSMCVTNYKPEEAP